MYLLKQKYFLMLLEELLQEWLILQKRPTKMTSGEFNNHMLQQDIEVKEGELLRATISMIVHEMPDSVKGKTLITKE